MRASSPTLTNCVTSATQAAATVGSGGGDCVRMLVESATRRWAAVSTAGPAPNFPVAVCRACSNVFQSSWSSLLSVMPDAAHHWARGPGLALAGATGDVGPGGFEASGGDPVTWGAVVGEVVAGTWVERGVVARGSTIGYIVGGTKGSSTGACHATFGGLIRGEPTRAAAAPAPPATTTAVTTTQVKGLRADLFRVLQPGIFEEPKGRRARVTGSVRRGEVRPVTVGEGPPGDAGAAAGGTWSRATRT